MESRFAGFALVCCDALRLSNHRDGRSEQVLGSRVARAERWRSVAAASAVVERREASAPQGARRAARHGGYGTAPFGVPLSFFVIASREAAKQSRLCAADPGLLRRHSPSKTGVNALLPRNDEDFPRVIMMPPVPPPAASDEDRARMLFVCLGRSKTRVRRGAARRIYRVW
jgi:hypothetical protein